MTIYMTNDYIVYMKQDRVYSDIRVIRIGPRVRDWMKQKRYGYHSF